MRRIIEVVTASFVIGFQAGIGDKGDKALWPPGRHGEKADWIPTTSTGVSADWCDQVGAVIPPTPPVGW